MNAAQRRKKRRAQDRLSPSLKWFRTLWRTKGKEMLFGAAVMGAFIDYVTHTTETETRL